MTFTHPMLDASNALTDVTPVATVPENDPVLLIEAYVDHTIGVGAPAAADSQFVFPEASFWMAYEGRAALTCVQPEPFHSAFWACQKPPATSRSSDH